MEQKLQDFIKEKGLKRDVTPQCSRLNREDGDYFVTKASEIGLRVDWAYKGIIWHYAYIH